MLDRTPILLALSLGCWAATGCSVPLEEELENTGGGAQVLSEALQATCAGHAEDNRNVVQGTIKLVPEGQTIRVEGAGVIWATPQTVDRKWSLTGTGTAGGCAKEGLAIAGDFVFAEHAVGEDLTLALPVLAISHAGEFLIGETLSDEDLALIPIIRACRVEGGLQRFCSGGGREPGVSAVSLPAQDGVSEPAGAGRVRGTSSLTEVY